MSGSGSKVIASIRRKEAPYSPHAMHQGQLGLCRLPCLCSLFPCSLPRLPRGQKLLAFLVEPLHQLPRLLSRFGLRVRYLLLLTCSLLLIFSQSEHGLEKQWTFL